MQKRLHQFMLLFVVATVIMNSVVRTTPVYADDGTTQPVDGETTSTDDGQTDTPTEEPPAVEESTPVAEIIDQLPADTDLVVVNDAGEIEPLATEAAAEIIVSGDPVWCPGSHTPGDTECTDGASTVAELLSDIASLSQINRTGAGTIFFTPNYAVSDATFNQSNAALSLITDLTIQGGWTGGTGGAFGLAGVTTFIGVPLTVVNWTGNVTLQDLNIAAIGSAGYGLYINNTGDVTLNHVSVDHTQANSLGFGDGAVLNSTGNVTITNSQFNGNQGNGLQTKSGGTITLTTVSASNNTLTGAFLDSCKYGSITSGLCAGSGLVTVTSGISNLFNDNGFNGLVVDAGGGITIDHTHANNASGHGVNGAVLTSADNNGTGNVTVNQSEFSGNANGNGLDILTDGSITLANIDALSNRTGAVLDTKKGVGAITVNNSNFGTTIFTGNTGTGLHAESGSTASLGNVVASGNGTNGAYLTAEGNITVANSTFNDNVHFNYPQDPGLYAKSNGGKITLTNVIADGNDYGAGAVLITKDGGAIDVTNITNSTSSHFNNNGTFGLQAQSQNGNITLNGITASNNMVKGAYLESYGAGNISITQNSFFINSIFDANGSYGIYANASLGNINLADVHVNGFNVTDYGAVLVTSNGGTIFVNNGIFNNNTQVGLKIIASGDVNLTHVVAQNNGVNGVEVYSTYTAASPFCPIVEVVNVTVNVDGGTFTNNGEYGVMVKPGPEGTVNFINPPTYNLNGIGGFLLDLSGPTQSPDCGSYNERPSKEPKKVQVPFSGGTPVNQDCDLFSSTILELPNGTWANVGCPFAGFSNLEELLKDNLPGPLGAGTNFEAGVIASLTDGEGNPLLNGDATLTISFKIPKDSRGRGYSIMFWDPTLNDGVGGWVQMPLFEAGTSFPLNPNDPNDQRTVISGVQQNGDTVTFTVNFPGVFVLVSR